MIIWLASYPKSGNTFLRSLIAAYFYCERGVYNQNSLAHLPEYPRDYFKLEKETNPLREFSRYEQVQKSISLNNRKFNFVKTHLANIKVNDIYYCINPLYTSCAIYIIRDPRNVLLSLKDYIKEDDEKTLEYMLGDIFRSEYYKNNKVQHTHIGNWETNFLSWQKSLIHFPIKFVKYEDLATNTKEEFLKILLFLKNYMDINIDTNKVNQIVENNSFEKLSKREKLTGFPEASYNGDSKFFNKGLARNYKKELSNSIINQIEKKFYNTMLKFNYL